MKTAAEVALAAGRSPAQRPFPHPRCRDRCAYQWPVSSDEAWERSASADVIAWPMSLAAGGISGEGFPPRRHRRRLRSGPSAAVESRALLSEQPHQGPRLSLHAGLLLVGKHLADGQLTVVPGALGLARRGAAGYWPPLLSMLLSTRPVRVVVVRPLAAFALGLCAVGD